MTRQLGRQPISDRRRQSVSSAADALTGPCNDNRDCDCIGVEVRCCNGCLLAPITKLSFKTPLAPPLLLQIGDRGMTWLPTGVMAWSAGRRVECSRLQCSQWRPLIPLSCSMLANCCRQACKITSSPLAIFTDCLKHSNFNFCILFKIQAYACM